MRSNGPAVVLGGVLFLFLCGAAAVFACSLSGRGIATHAIDVYATTEARPLTVGERAAEIREETRLDNPNGIPAGFWIITIGAILIVVGGTAYLVLGKEFFQAKADSDKQKRLLDKTQRKSGLPSPHPAPSPYHVIDQSSYAQVPTRPHLPAPPSLRQLEDRHQG